MTEQKLSHLNEQGEAHMVDISEKEITNRVAIAEGFVYMQPETFNILAKGDSQKGDVLASARIAGIMAAKKNPRTYTFMSPAFSDKGNGRL